VGEVGDGLLVEGLDADASQVDPVGQAAFARRRIFTRCAKASPRWKAVATSPP
jgi:hypothetical protein